jgi:hypothetical protein
VRHLAQVRATPPGQGKGAREAGHPLPTQWQGEGLECARVPYIAFLWYERGEMKKPPAYACDRTHECTLADGRGLPEDLVSVAGVARTTDGLLTPEGV